MSSKERETVWDAEPHTLAKIAILRAYLDAWFPILGRSKNRQPILYVDGFAGPGEYKNHPDGSPVAALAAARTAIDAAGAKWVAGGVHCYFIEDDQERSTNLETRLSKVAIGKGVKVQILNGKFADRMNDVKTAMPASFQRAYPLFVFIDPFGATGVPFTVVADILRSNCSEVLINLDVDGIARIFKAEESADFERLLNSVFGDHSWRASLNAHHDFPVLCRQVLDLYKLKLRSLPNVRYVFPFEMRNKDDALSYYLLFASQEALGLEKMKEAMRGIDHSGAYCFSDGRIGQDNLFKFDDPVLFANDLHRRFLGRDISAADLRDYALNETPFVNAKAMLRMLEGRDLITVSSLNPKRKRSDFNEETLVSVKFVAEKPAGTRHEQGVLFSG